jgi:hypothetical protein
MSKFEVHQITCPECGHAQEEKVYVSLSGARMQAATDAIIDGRWGRIRCAACGHEFYLDHLLLYTNLPGRQWVVQYPRSQLPQYATLEIEAEQTFQLEYLSRPPAEIRDQSKDVTRRICFGLPQLAEKLQAWRNGIDDRALECLKLVLMRDRIGELFDYGPTELYLSDCSQDRLTILAISRAEQKPVHRMDIERADVDRIGNHLDDFLPRFPALFCKLYVNAGRYLS